MTLDQAKWIPWLSAAAAVLGGLCAARRSLRWLAAPLSIVALVAGFLITLGVGAGIGTTGPWSGITLRLWPWIEVGGFRADFAYYLDALTLLMLLVVTGVGTLVAIYAAGYMKGDRGYARFFAFVGLFIFAMTTLVMADNLVLLYLGWEGVGLCSYLLIGYYYDKPAAVAAAKKAFIVNRIGDLGFALGIFVAYQSFGTVHLPTLLQAAATYTPESATPAMQVLPFLLMLGAFGKSAQLPLYMWLPDAMEGPTPVSALIHAATMVTAGVYLIVRMMPVFVLSPYALPAVAVVGTATALFAATIALCQYDLKRVFAYSTVSQLGYMFLGVGAFSATGAMFHLFTHAFFKALLFLTAGSVMHAMAGQLDLRRMSGLGKKMPLTAGLMLVGCLALAGVPPLAGFYSKDLILADALALGRGGHHPLYLILAGVGLLTALLTSFYTFRVWFRVFMGPPRFEMGTEHHGTLGSPRSVAGDALPDTEAQAVTEPGHVPAHPGAGAADAAHAHAAGGHDEPHEVSLLMNAPLLVLAIGAAVAGLAWVGLGEPWIAARVAGSTAAWPRPVAVEEAEHLPLLGMDPHLAVAVLSTLADVAGIALAAWFHWLRRPAADRFAARFRGPVRVLARKYFVDEFVHEAVVRPLRILGDVLFILDRLVVEGIVSLVTWVPTLVGLSVRPTQRGLLQGYGLAMVFGIAALLFLVFAART